MIRKKDLLSGYRFDANSTVTGVYHATRKGMGFVQPDEDPNGQDMYIAAEDTLGAMDGDEVAVKVTQEGFTVRNIVTEVLEHSRTKAVGVASVKKNKVVVTPISGRLPDIKISRKHTMDAADGDLVVVQFLTYGDGTTAPTGAVIEDLGQKDAPGADITAILKDMDVPTDFTEEEKQQAQALADAQASDSILSTSSEPREDLRSLLSVTIDEPGTEDMDDAISLTKKDNGWELGVHIADASYFIRENTPLDAVARERGTSVYLPDRVVPMLPEVLSNDVCSLRAGEDRLAMSVLMQVSEDGEISDYRITPSIIRVAANMDYPQAQAVLDGADLPETEAGIHPGADAAVNGEENAAAENEAAFSGNSVTSMLHELQKVSDKLAARRHDRGEITFDLPDVKVILDEKGLPTQLQVTHENAAQKMVSACMIAANETVARYMKEQDIPGIFRVHEEPDAVAVQTWRSQIQAGTAGKADAGPQQAGTAGKADAGSQQAGTVGKADAGPQQAGTADKADAGSQQAEAAQNAAAAQPGKPGTAPVSSVSCMKTQDSQLTPGEVQSTLEAFQGTPDENYVTLTTLRMMSRAHYDAECRGHFGLAARYYCHFTSPIRRYPDLLVHRLLHEQAAGTLDADRKAAYRDTLGDLTQHCSDREHRSIECERTATRLKLTQYLGMHLGEEADGIITSVTKNGIFVELPDTCEGFIAVRDMSDDYYNYEEETSRLVGKNTGRTLRLGDPVHIRVVSTDLMDRSATFAPA